MRMVILDGYTLNPGDLGWDAIRCLVDELIVYDRTPEDEIDERSKGADIIATNKVTVSARTIAHVSELKFIPVTATGFDMVDIKAAGERGIPVSNVPEYGTDSVAQYTFGLILEHCHRVGLHTDAVRDGEWKAAPDWCFWKTPQVLLKGKTMGIVGFGRIGRRVGELAHAFGLEILAYDVQQDSVQVGYPFSWSSLEDLFSRSDIVSMHCPLTPENTGVVNERTLSLMKKDAFFINNARGGLVNEKDLADALNRGKDRRSGRGRRFQRADPGGQPSAGREKLPDHAAHGLGHVRSPPEAHGHDRGKRKGLPRRPSQKRRERSVFEIKLSIGSP